MQVIIINSQKGGSGKTMLTKHLAVEAERAGDGPIVMIDNDPQASLSSWHERREAESPGRLDISFNELEKGLAVLRQRGVAYCFIDTASGRVDVARQLFKFADLVLFPVQPSEEDLKAAPVTIQALKEQGTPFLFILTRVNTRALITAQTVAMLSKHGQVAETFVSDRTGYKSPYAKGQTVTEATPSGPAAQEIGDLWQNIKSCLHENMKSFKEAV